MPATLGVVAAIAGIALGIVVESTAGSNADALASPMSILALAASVAGLVALVVALAGFESGPSAPRGRLASVAILTTLAGAALTAGAAWSGLVIAPWFATAMPANVEPPEALLVASTLSYALLGLGAILLGIAIRRDGTGPGMGHVAPDHRWNPLHPAAPARAVHRRRRRIGGAAPQPGGCSRGSPLAHASLGSQTTGAALRTMRWDGEDRRCLFRYYMVASRR